MQLEIILVLSMPSNFFASIDCPNLKFVFPSIPLPSHDVKLYFTNHMDPHAEQRQWIMSHDLPAIGYISLSRHPEPIK